MSAKNLLNVLFMFMAFAGFFSPAEAQGPYARVYTGEFAMYGNAIVALPSGESAVAGLLYDDLYYGMFARFDRDGKLLIQRGYEAADESFHIQFYSMIQTTKGDFVLAGSACRITACGDFIVVRVNPDGELIWKKLFSTKQIDYYTSLVATPDDGFVLGGMSGTCCADGDASAFRDHHAVIIRGTASGEILWKRRISIVSNPSGVYPRSAIVASSNGGFVFISASEVEEEKYGLLLLNISKNGRVHSGKTILLGERSLIESYYLPGPWVSSTSDGGFIVAATTVEVESGKEEYYIELLRFDSSQNVVWAKSYEGKKNIEASGNVIQSSDGGFVLAASKSYPSDPLIMKVSDKGEPLWAKRFLFAKGRADFALAVAEEISGSYVATGVLTDVSVNKVPLFRFAQEGKNSCDSFRKMKITAEPQQVSISDVGLNVEDPELKIRNARLKVLIPPPLKSRECTQN